MSSLPPLHEVPIDRREETVITQQPGYAATQQVTRDVAAEQRLRLLLVTRILVTIVAFLEILLGMRLVLKMLAADPHNGFALFLYALTDLFVVPFVGLVPAWVSGASTFEVTTLVAMPLYVLFFWGIDRALRIVVERPTFRMFSRTTRRQTLDDRGNLPVVIIPALPAPRVVVRRLSAGLRRWVTPRRPKAPLGPRD